MSDKFSMGEIQDSIFLSYTCNKIISIYESILRIRMVEKRFSDVYKEQEIRCPMHLSIGQEAVSVGISLFLKKEDHVYSAHRAHAHYLAKGGDLKSMVAEAYGKETGCCGGRGGSQHLIDLNVGFMGSTPIVGGTVPLAVGDAWSAKLQGKSRVTVAYFGDGCFEEGVMHESMNFASLHKLPIIFVCENNKYSVYTNISDRQPSREIHNVAASHGISSFCEDGNNISSIVDTSFNAINNVRKGEGPQFIEFQTYRWLEHCGPNDDDDLGYRPRGELSLWKERCPVKWLESYMLNNNVLNENKIQNIESRILKEIDNAYEYALNSKNPDPQNMDKHIYA
jgi:TPP-dependent pyruvate/acetoin dehydrogenase alpha subunit